MKFLIALSIFLLPASGAVYAQTISNSNSGIGSGNGNGNGNGNHSNNTTGVTRQ